MTTAKELTEYTFKLPIVSLVRKVNTRGCEFNTDGEDVCQLIGEVDNQYYLVWGDEANKLSYNQMIYILNSYQYNFNFIISRMMREGKFYGNVFSTNVNVELANPEDFADLNVKGAIYWQYCIKLNTLAEIPEDEINQELDDVDISLLPVVDEYNLNLLRDGYEPVLASIICDFNFQLTTNGYTQHLKIFPSIYNSQCAPRYYIDGGIYVDLRVLGNFQEAYQYIVNKLVGDERSAGVESYGLTTPHAI